jgi:hypothetical protein
MTAPTHDHAAAHRRFCELLNRAGLPQPDETAYFSRAVVFLFHHSQAVILIDLDEPDDEDWTAGELADLGGSIDPPPLAHGVPPAAAFHRAG